MEQMASRPFAGVAVELDAQLLVISAHSENDDHRKKVVIFMCIFSLGSM